MTLTLLRHPRVAEAAGICYGRLDLAADAAHEDAVFAQTVAELPPQPVFCSPSQRCSRLAQRLAAHWGVACVANERLRELDFGTWEGRAWADIPRAGIDTWAADTLHCAPGGGESLWQLGERLAPWLAEMRRRRSDCLVVTHGGPLRVLAAWLEGRDLATAAKSPAPPCGSRVAFTW